MTMHIGTLGDGVPEEILRAAGADVVEIEGEPGGPTDIADEFVEPMVGERARSQLQRLLDGTYDGLDCIIVSREADAPLRLFYTLREVRRLEPGRLRAEVHLFDFQHLDSDPVWRYNLSRGRALMDLVGAPASALPEAIEQCNSERAAQRARAQGTGSNGSRRVYLTGSSHRETGLRARVEAAGGTVVGDANDRSRVDTAQDADPLAAILRRQLHPALARARADSVQRGRWMAAEIADSQAEVVVAWYLEGDDGLRWEYPVLAQELARQDVEVVMYDRQHYGLEGVEINV